MPGVAYVVGTKLVGATETPFFAFGTIQGDGWCYFNDNQFWRCRQDGSGLHVNNKDQQWVESTAISSIRVQVFDVSVAIGGGGGVAPNADIERAVQWCINIANDASHGYDQAHRTGPDYDCSSFVCAGLREAGFDIGFLTVSTMAERLPSLGFQALGSSVANNVGQLMRGDILVGNGHCEMYIGGGQNVGAHSNEFGGITGGRTGDQSGHEISVGGYYSFPWTNVYRFTR